MTNEEILAQAGDGEGGLPPPPGQQPPLPKSIWQLVAEEMERRNREYQREMAELGAMSYDRNGMEALRKVLLRRRM